MSATTLKSLNILYYSLWLLTEIFFLDKPFNSPN